MRQVRKFPSLKTVAAMLLFPGCVGAQGNQVDPTAYAYAKMYQVSYSDAERRLQQEREAGILQERIQREQPVAFAGMYIEHKPEFRVFVKFTGKAGASLSRYTKDPRYVPLNAPRSLEVLKSVQDEVGDELLRSGINFESGLDIKKSEVNVYVLNPNQARRRLLAIMKIASFIRIHQTTGFVDLTSISGGKKVTGAARQCTAGFNVVDSNRVLGITTAGHCDNSLTYEPSYQLIFQAEADSGSYDVQWNKQPPSAAQQIQTNEITVVGGPSNPLKITGTTPKSTMMVGSTVCKSGITTNYTCGAIADLNAQVVYKNVAGSYIRVHQASNQIMADDGDSGGPVFSGANAFGIVHGRGAVGTATRNDLYFMPIDLLSGIHVSVVTRPFTIGAIPNISGPRGTTLPLKINFKGYLKFPVTVTTQNVSCPSDTTCTGGDDVVSTNVASPLTIPYTCSGTSTQPSTSTWQSYLKDASGIQTVSVQFSATCTAPAIKAQD